MNGSLLVCTGSPNTQVLVSEVLHEAGYGRVSMLRTTEAEAKAALVASGGDFVEGVQGAIGPLGWEVVGLADG